MLLHTYHRVAEIGELRVRGLKGDFVNHFLDKVSGTDEVHDEGEEGFIVSKETDRVYRSVGDKFASSGVTIAPVTKDGGRKCTITIHAPEGEEVDCVVWNPWVDKSKRLDDFGDEEYHEMICVEPGFVHNQKSLAPGASVYLQQKMTWENHP